MSFSINNLITIHWKYKTVLHDHLTRLTFFLLLKGATFETIDPRTGEVTARVSEGAKEDIDAAVKAAREAFDHGPWPRLPGTVRYSFAFLFF